MVKILIGHKYCIRRLNKNIFSGSSSAANEPNFKIMCNRRYAHSITRTKNDQLSVGGAKLDGNLKAEVPYKSMGSKCTERSVWQAKWPVLSSSGELLLEPHLLPILLYGTSTFKLPSSFAPSTLN